MKIILTALRKFTKPSLVKPQNQENYRIFNGYTYNRTTPYLVDFNTIVFDKVGIGNALEVLDLISNVFDRLMIIGLEADLKISDK